MYVLLELLENDKKIILFYFLRIMITFCLRFYLVYVGGKIVG